MSVLGRPLGMVEDLKRELYRDRPKLFFFGLMCRGASLSSSAMKEAIDILSIFS